MPAAPLHNRRRQVTVRTHDDFATKSGLNVLAEVRFSRAATAFSAMRKPPGCSPGLRAVVTPEAVRKALGEAGFSVIDLRAWFSGVRQKHAPGSLEREQAEAAIKAFKLLADRRALGAMAARGCLMVDQDARR